MDKNILDFTDITSGWLNIEIYDHRFNIIRKMRVSYIQPFFNDVLMACKFLLSDITGTYELYLDQEGFEGAIRFFKYNDKKISLEIKEEQFEDEKPDLGEEVDEFIEDSINYFNIDIEEFVGNMLSIIRKREKEYNEGFVFTPADKLNKELLLQVKKIYRDKYLGGGQ